MFTFFDFFVVSLLSNINIKHFEKSQVSFPILLTFSLLSPKGKSLHSLHNLSSYVIKISIYIPIS